MTRTFIIKKMIRRLVELFCLAVIITVLTALLYTVMSILSHRVLIREALKSMPRPILLAWLAYLLFNQNVKDYDKKSREETKMIRDVESHFLERCPGKAISGHFRYGRKLTWYAWLRTDEKEECQATEVGDEAHSSVIIHDLKTGRLLGNFVYPASFSRLDKDKKIALIKEKMKAAYDRPVYLTDCAANNNSQTNPFVSFETTTGDRYLETEIEADEMRIRFIHDLRTGAVVDSWTVLNKDHTIQ